MEPQPEPEPVVKPQPEPEPEPEPELGQSEPTPSAAALLLRTPPRSASPRPARATTASPSPRHFPVVNLSGSDTRRSDEEQLEEQLLDQLNIGQLRRRCAAAGVDTALVRQAIDESDDPRRELLALLQRPPQSWHTQRCSPDLAQELAALRVGELRPRALALGITIEEIEETVDHAASPRRALASLILQAHATLDASASEGRAGRVVRTREVSREVPRTVLDREELQVMTLEMPRPAWDTQTVDVERTVLEPRQVTHTVQKTRLVPSKACLSLSASILLFAARLDCLLRAETILVEEPYEESQVRTVMQPRTVVEQEQRRVLGTAVRTERLLIGADDSVVARDVLRDDFRHSVDRRSVVGPPSGAGAELSHTPVRDGNWRRHTADHHHPSMQHLGLTPSHASPFPRHGSPSPRGVRPSAAEVEEMERVMLEQQGHSLRWLGHGGRTPSSF